MEALPVRSQRAVADFLAAPAIDPIALARGLAEDEEIEPFGPIPSFWFDPGQRPPPARPRSRAPSGLDALRPALTHFLLLADAPADAAEALDAARRFELLERLLARRLPVEQRLALIESGRRLRGQAGAFSDAKGILRRVRRWLGERARGYRWVDSERLIPNPEDIFTRPKGPSDAALADALRFLGRNGDTRKPIMAYEIGSGWWLMTDGHHDHLAAQKAGLRSVRVLNTPPQDDPRVVRARPALLPANLSLPLTP